MMTVWVASDAAACAVGADRVAAALTAVAAARGVPLAVKRSSSRGALWLEPLVEVEVDGARVGYANVRDADVATMFETLQAGAAHAQRVGDPAALPFLARQTRLTFARAGLTTPLDVAAYARLGGWQGLAAALRLTPAAIVEEIVASGLRGRGGAAFPTGVKWRTVAATPAAQRYIVCNADEGDSGTFADRMLIEGDPFALIEGMIIAGLAVGATEGYVYVRSEYPRAEATLREAIGLATAAGYLGARVAGSGYAFTLHVRRGAGAYICGEETALLESLEGKRGMVRAKPPLPAVAGLWGKPTVVNNVLTLAAVPTILAHGAVAYAAHGAGTSRGTQVFQLAGNIKRGGLVEVGFGLTLRELIYEFGGGTRSGRPVRAVQVGGPLAPYLAEAQLDAPLTYEGLAAAGGMLGHGGVVVFDDTVDMAAMARHAMAFCAHESCGKCTPCRVGAQRGRELLDAVPGPEVTRRLIVLRDLCQTMVDGSMCAMGSMTPLPVLSAMERFPEDFAAKGGA